MPIRLEYGEERDAQKGPYNYIACFCGPRTVLESSTLINFLVELKSVGL